MTKISTVVFVIIFIIKKNNSKCKVGNVKHDKKQSQGVRSLRTPP